jgi:hypothetical protein
MRINTTGGYHGIELLSRAPNAPTNHSTRNIADAWPGVSQSQEGLKFRDDAWPGVSQSQEGMKFRDHADSKGAQPTRRLPSFEPGLAELPSWAACRMRMG